MRAILLMTLLVAAPCVAQDFDPNYLATFSIAARDPATGELGFAVQSKAFAAGNRAVHIKAGVGVIAHQASANPMYGEIGFELLQAGFTPQQALDMMLRSDEGRDSRQVAILDVEGRSASWDGRARTTGKDTSALPTTAHRATSWPAPKLSRRWRACSSRPQGVRSPSG